MLFDAILIPGGKQSVKQLLKTGKYGKFVSEAFKHCKAIAVLGAGEDLLKNNHVQNYKEDKAVFVDAKPQEFIEAIAQHRNWERMDKVGSIPV